MLERFAQMGLKSGSEVSYHFLRSANSVKSSESWYCLVRRRQSNQIELLVEHLRRVYQCTLRIWSQRVGLVVLKLSPLFRTKPTVVYEDFSRFSNGGLQVAIFQQLFYEFLRVFENFSRSVEPCGQAGYIASAVGKTLYRSKVFGDFLRLRQ